MVFIKNILFYQYDGWDIMRTSKGKHATLNALMGCYHRHFINFHNVPLKITESLNQINMLGGMISRVFI